MPAFNIDAYLEERKSLIDRALEEILRERPLGPERLRQAMRYGLFPGGKRFRPILVMAAGELFSARQHPLLPFACALELIHAYSLIHDDLPALDNDDIRRGAPTCHKVFGEGMALLAGDALLTETFCVLSRPELAQELGADLLLELVSEVAHAAGVGGMVGGQALDLEAEEREAGLAEVENIHVRKTGALIRVAVKIGARIGGAAHEDLRAVSRFAEFLGLAYQIADDILDAQGYPSENGREAKEKKKATYPSVVGLPAAKARVEELLQQCLKEVERFGGGADPLRGLARYAVERAL